MSGNGTAKSQLRRELLLRRDGLATAERQQAALALAARPFPLRMVPGLVVSGFCATRSEIDPLPLMRVLADGGARLALPVVLGRAKPLSFRAYTVGEALKPGVWGIGEPFAEAPDVTPDILLVPLVAFDRRGQRIGYGAGYYDLTLTKLRESHPIIAIGVAFAIQEIPAVPATVRDARLDLVLTEREVIDCREA